MSTEFGSLAEEFYVSSRLFLKLDISFERGTALHFFDQVRKAFPGMTRLRRRDDGCLILEEDGDSEAGRRWMRLDQTSLRFGQFNPQAPDDVRKLAEVVFEQAPYHLAFSELDFDHLEIVYGFDLEYRGNHDQLLAETFWSEHPLSSFLFGDQASHIIDAQPYFGIALTPECDMQAYVEVKSRTNTYEIRGGEFEPQPLSVYLTVRKYWTVGQEASLIEITRRMFELADELAANKIVPLVVNPLAQAIASRS